MYTQVKLILNPVKYSVGLAVNKGHTKKCDQCVQCEQPVIGPVLSVSKDKSSEQRLHLLNATNSISHFNIVFIKLIT